MSYMKEQGHSWFDAAALLCILAFAAFLSLEFFYGPSNVDQMDSFIYSAIAVYSAQPNFWPQGLGAFASTKLAEIFGMRFFYSLLGVSRLSESLLGISSFLLTIVVVFLIGKSLGGRRAALLSSLFYSFMPLAVVEASVSSDDVVMTLFVSLSVLFVVLAIKRRRNLYYFLSGFTAWFGILSSIEEATILALLVLLLIFWLWESGDRRKQATHTAWFALGVLAAALLIVLISFILSGDPARIYADTISWYNISWLARSHAPIPAFQNVIAALFSFGASGSSAGFGYFGYAMLPAVAYLLARRSKNAAIPALWFVVTFLFLSFGSSSLIGYHFIQYKIRYMLIFVPALVLILGLGTDKVIADMKMTRQKLEKHGRRITIGIVLLGASLLMANSVLLIQYNQYVNHADMYPIMNISQSLLALPAGTPVYVNLYLTYQLQFYMDYANNLESYMITPPPCGFLVGGASNLTVTGGALLRSNISRGSLMVDSQDLVLNQSCETFEPQLDPALPEWLSQYRVDYNYSWGWAELYRLG